MGDPGLLPVFAEIADGLARLTATPPAALPGQAAALHGALRRAVAGGLGGLAAGTLISAVNDRLAGRVIALAAARHRLPAVAWCWLAFGSEGRGEQTLFSDQDNGLVFQAADAREAAVLRELFLPFAAEANGRLAECGFVRCPGEIMAGNRQWCLSLDEWRERFVDWVRVPDPAALLNATIFFDLRPLYGARALGDELAALAAALAADTPAFLHLLGANALQAAPPLNFRGELAAGPLDLKKFGSRLFVDAARILGLAAGVAAPATAHRLRQGGAVAGLPDDEIEALLGAFDALLRRRLLAQLAGEGGAAAASCTAAGLDDFARHTLRGALRQAQRLQQRIKLNYAL